MSLDAAGSGAGEARERHWKANLLAASAAGFAVTFGVSVSNPLVPSLLHRELGIQDPGELAFWSGLGSAVGPLAFAVASPAWGILADRFGRRNALIRAVLAATICTVALGFVQNVGQLTFVRAMTGLTAGANAGTFGLVAAETPPAHLARAFGILTSARALAQTAAPAIGGLVGSVLPLRVVFSVGGVLVLLAMIPVLRVHETSRRMRGERAPSIAAALGARGPVRRAILALIAAQGLAYLTLAGTQQMLLIRVIELDPDHAVFVSGVAFALLSLATVLGGLACGRLVRLRGYRLLALGAGLVLAAAAVASGQAASLPAVVGAAVVLGLGFGTHGPATASMLGLETSAGVKGTIFGLVSSSQQVGVAIGALGSGAVAAAIGTTGSLRVIALAGILAALVVAIWGREPPETGEAKA